MAKLELTLLRRLPVALNNASSTHQSRRGRRLDWDEVEQADWVTRPRDGSPARKSHRGPRYPRVIFALFLGYFCVKQRHRRVSGAGAMKARGGWPDGDQVMLEQGAPSRKRLGIHGRADVRFTSGLGPGSPGGASTLDPASSPARLDQQVQTAARRHHCGCLRRHRRGESSKRRVLARSAQLYFRVPFPNA
jgi:hypothetical protein